MGTRGVREGSGVSYPVDFNYAVNKCQRGLFYIQLSLLVPAFIELENTVCTDEILITAVVSSNGCKGDTCLRQMRPELQSV